MKKDKTLESVLEDNGFSIYTFTQDGEQCAELETWTDGGVNMIPGLMPFTFEKFEQYVNDFDIDEEIDINRKNLSYVANFSIKESLADFTGYHKKLKRIVAKYKKKTLKPCR